MGQIVNLSQISNFVKHSTEFSNFGGEYVFTHVTSANPFPRNQNGPFRVDGAIWMLCVEGEFEIEVNLHRFSIGPGSLVVTTPNSIVEIKSVADSDFDCYTLIVSTGFLRDINFDLNILSSIDLKNHDRRKPVITLSGEDVNLLRHYFDLIHHNTTANPDDMYVRSISRCIIAALSYQMMQMAAKYYASVPEEASESSRSRSRRFTYEQEFMALVHRYHTKERSVAFYADKLFISPKYLSLIIKEVTGRTAAEWIDEFVILEAKNLLRFSGKNIQQIAYELNFPNQSSFGKYFKHLTGMSPSQYQRS